MTSKASNLAVFAYLDGESIARPAGLLQLVEDGSELLESSFRYGKKYATRGNRLELDPLSLQIPGAGIDQARSPMNALPEFGIFRDTAPDLWGRRLIENKLRKVGPLPESVYLLQAGNNRTGALDFRGTIQDPEPGSGLASILDLAHLREAADRIENGQEIPAHLEKIFLAGPSMGGARPKAVVEDDNVQWLAKFSSKTDLFCVPWIEYGTLRLAAAAGLRVPALRIEQLGPDRPAMLIERFDRIHHGNGYTRRHFMSALTLLARHESESQNTTYSEIVEAFARVGSTRAIKHDAAELFGRMIFNILVNNNDDHLRNHGFIHDPAQGGWTLSPLYDVVPAPTYSQDRYLHLGIGDAGREASLPNAMSSHGVFGLAKDEALSIIDRVGRVTREWAAYFESYGVPLEEIDKVRSAFRSPRQAGAERIR